MLPAAHRLKSRTDFERLFAEGSSYQGAHLSLRVAAADSCRIAIVAGKRVSAKATVRNRTKRRLRGLLRAHPEILQKPHLVAVYAKPGADRLEYGQLDEELTELLQKARLLK